MDSAKCPCEALIPEARIPLNSMCASKTCISTTRRAWEFPYNWSRCVHHQISPRLQTLPPKAANTFIWHSICSSSLPRISINNRPMISKMHPLSTTTPSFHCTLFCTRLWHWCGCCLRSSARSPLRFPSYDHAFDIWTLNLQLISLSLLTWYKIHNTIAVLLKVLHICWLSCRWSQIFGQVCQMWCNHYSSYFNAPAQADNR